MKIYQIAQNLQLLQTPNEFHGAILPQSEKIMEELGIKDALTELAKTEGYHTPLDYVLCSLYPEYKEACKQFYNDYEESLEDVVSKGIISKIDNIVAQALVVFWKEFRKNENISNG